MVDAHGRNVWTGVWTMKFKFFCYDPHGCPEELIFEAVDEDAAWDQFDQNYSDYYVDEILALTAD